MVSGRTIEEIYSTLRSLPEVVGIVWPELQITRMNSEYPVQLSDSIREVVSWRLMAELMRRHPQVGTLIETHPGGGQYDCLTIFRDGQSIASLNRSGDFTPFHRFQEQIGGDQIWLPCMSEDGFANVLNKLSSALGLDIPMQLPKTSTEVLIYRVIAGSLACSFLDKVPLGCRNGQLDSSGGEDQGAREVWFKAFPSACAERNLLNRSESPLGNPNYRFWFLLRQNQPVLALCMNGISHTMAGLTTDLADLYRRRRRIEDVIGAVLSICA